MSANRFLPTYVASAALCAALAAPAAHAFSDNEARKAILELRQQLREMTEQNARARLQLADQIERLEREVTRLREELEHAARPQAGKQAAGGDNGTPSVSDPQEQAAYDGAIDLFRNGQYKEAAEALNAFLTLYGDSALVPTAQFYLGSSRYATKDYKGAIEELQEMVKNSPDNARAPDALLVIAGSQLELNNRAGAKTTLQRIVRDYANTPAAATASKRLELL